MHRGPEHAGRIERLAHPRPRQIAPPAGPLLGRPALAALLPAALAPGRLVGSGFAFAIVARELPRLRLLGRPRLLDVLELLLLGIHAEEDLRDATDRHHAGADQERDHYPRAAVRSDQVPEEERPDDPAEPGADGIEERDRERACLHREYL